MTTWNDCDAAKQTDVLQKCAAVYAKHSELAGQGPAVKGEFVFNLKAGSNDLNNTLALEAKISLSAAGKLDEIKRELNAAVEGVSDAQIQVACGHKIGDVPKNIAEVTNFEGNNVTFEHSEGQVVLLDFWATWCPPCQAPMAHNQEMLVKHADKWGDKVRIVGLSIDQDLQTVKNHVNAKGWTKVEHYHVRNGKCTGDKDFGVRGVPHCLLLDKTGKIVFIGHPATRTLDKDIDDLLAGKTISGKGCGPDTAEAAGNLDAATYGDAKTFFLKKTEEIMKTEGIKEAAQPCARAFLVMTSEGSWDAASSSIKYSADFHNVLMGPQASITKIDEAATELNAQEGTWWKLNKGHRAM